MFNMFIDCFVNLKQCNENSEKHCEENSKHCEKPQPKLFDWTGEWAISSLPISFLLDGP